MSVTPQPPTPQAPQPNPVQQIAQEGGKLLRPFQKASAFLQGTFNGIINGMSQYGRTGSTMGMWAGLALGIINVAGFTPLLLAYVAGGFLAGFFGGAALGAVVEGVKGGPAALAVAERKEKYADAVAERNMAHSRAAAQRYYGRQSQQGRVDMGYANFDHFQQRQDIMNDQKAAQQSWTDRVDESRQHPFGLGL